MDVHNRAALVAEIKQQLKSEMGLMPVSIMSKLVWRYAKVDPASC